MKRKTSNKQDLILKDKNILKGLLILSLPVMFNNILKSFHDMVDIILVGNMDRDVAIRTAQKGAIGFVGPVLSICMALAAGLMIAGVAIISQYIGAKREDKAKKVSGQLLLLCIIVGVVFNIILYFSTPAILDMMKVLPDVREPAIKYLQIRSFELVGLFIFYAYQASCQASGDTINPVIWNVASIVINMVLTSLFVLGFDMDLTGAAFATVIANNIIILPCIIHMCKRNYTKLELKDLVPNWHYIGKLFKLGLPSAASQAFTSLGFLMINTMMSSHLQNLQDGASVLSAITTGNRINSMLLFPAMGVGTVLSTYVGQNIGAGNVKRAKKTFVYAAFLSMIISVVGILILMPLRGAAASAMGAESSELELCKQYLYYLLFGLPLMSIFQCFNGVFQGAGRTELSLTLSTIRLWVFRVPVLYLMLFVFDIGIKSVWICMNISNFGAFFLGAFLYLLVDFKPRISGIKKKLSKELEVA